MGDSVLRGVGFRGGSYEDMQDVLPLTGAPATEIRGVHPPFFSDYFFPVLPWKVNYIGALTGTQSDLTRLVVLPAQYRSSSPASITGTLRQFESMAFRLYYSSNIDSFTCTTDSTRDCTPDDIYVPAQAAPPLIADISAAYDEGASAINFQATVVGDPTAGIQEVWVVYTIEEDQTECELISIEFEEDQTGCGEWISIDLVQVKDDQGIMDSRIWTGTLELKSGIYPADVRYMVQAVNGVGLVSYATNQGSYYTPGVDPGAPPPVDQEETVLTIEPPEAGAYGTTVTFSSTLTNDKGQPLSGKSVIFALGAQKRLAITNDQGLAEATFLLIGLTGDTHLSVSLKGTDDYAPSTSTQSITINKQETMLSITPQDPDVIFGEEVSFTATLKDGVNRQLLGKTILFEVWETESNDLVYSEAVDTGFTGQAGLVLPPQLLGEYKLTARFWSPDTSTSPYLESTSETSLNINYDFNGFFQPVENPNILNMVKAGGAVPIKFSLAGDQGLEILERLPFVRVIDCDNMVSTNEITETIYPGSSFLSYDAIEDQYIYVWKTIKQFSGMCLQLVVQLVDGTEHIANFKFK